MGVECPDRRANNKRHQGAIISRVLSPQAVSLRTGLRWQPFIWAADCSARSSSQPGSLGAKHPCPLAEGARPLFGLAPGGVCHAVTVASPPVRSCRTLSPLPVLPRESSAVCSLWHFPLRPRRNAGGRYPPPLFRGARTFLASRKTRGCLRPPDRAAYRATLSGKLFLVCRIAVAESRFPLFSAMLHRVRPWSRSSSNCHRIAAISPSGTPVMFSGRQRRSNASTALA